jgi:hypothetical protein
LHTFPYTLTPSHRGVRAISPSSPPGQYNLAGLPAIWDRDWSALSTLSAQITGARMLHTGTHVHTHTSADSFSLGVGVGVGTLYPLPSALYLLPSPLPLPSALCHSALYPAISLCLSLLPCTHHLAIIPQNVALCYVIKEVFTLLSQVGC